MAQAFLTYEQQINLLNYLYMILILQAILQKISYYSLIDGYKEPCCKLNHYTLLPVLPGNHKMNMY